MLNILYQDDHILALNKPAGTLSVPGKISSTSLLEQVVARFPNARVVHRLDMATSGIILFALNHPAQKHLGRQFESRSIHKNYIAVADGLVEPDCGEIDAPLICDWPQRPRQKVDWQQGKTAHTRFAVMHRDRLACCSRLQLTPITGRSHQLRVHMQHLGHTIIGDALYADEAVKNRAPRLLLHAQFIEFIHPAKGTSLTINCEADF